MAKKNASPMPANLIGTFTIEGDATAEEIRAAAIKTVCAFSCTRPSKAPKIGAAFAVGTYELASLGNVRDLTPLGRAQLYKGARISAQQTIRDRVWPTGLTKVAKVAKALHTTEEVARIVIAAEDARLAALAAEIAAK